MEQRNSDTLSMLVKEIRVDFEASNKTGRDKLNYTENPSGSAMVFSEYLRKIHDCLPAGEARGFLSSTKQQPSNIKIIQYLTDWEE